jgi:potassium efflux system protein
MTSMVRGLIVAAAILVPRLFAQQTSPSSTPAPPEPVPLTQIAARYEDLRRILREISHQLPLSSELEDFEQQLEIREEAVRTGLEETEELLAGSATIIEIREHARQWRAFAAPETRQRKALEKWGAVCDQSIAELKKHEAVWRATLAGTQSLLELASVGTRVRQSLSEIEAVKGAAEDRLRTIVELQGRVSKQASVIADIVEKLGSATQSFQKRLFRADAPPIWKPDVGARDHQSVGAIVRRVLGRSYSNSREFVGNQQGLAFEIALVLALAIMASRRLVRAVNKANSSDTRLLKASDILSRWFAVSVLMTAPLVLGSLPVARMTLVLLTIQVFLLPIWRLSPLISGCRKRVAAFVAGFYGLHSLVWILDAEHAFGRELNAGLFGVTLGVLAWWGRPFRVRRSVPIAPHRTGELLRVRAAFAALALILLSNIFGFLLLSNLLRVVFVLSSYIALVIYTLAQVTLILIAAAVRLAPLNSLATMRLHESSFVRWTKRALGVGAAVWWLYLVLDLLALRGDVAGGIGRALDVKIGIKGFALSLGNVLECLCVLVGGYLIAGGIRFMLREEILARLRLSRGVPEMVATSAYYVSLVLVFLMSLAAAGVQLDKLTVLTGAFGVGVGFGMQNIISNFVSGLVLQFERPIRIGDVLEVGNLAGEVRRIGIRASLIRTFQGAEVIVPNSALVSNQVVNWTLSEPIRRVELQVPVAYGTAPERVVELLSKVARSHREVLANPEPGAFFQGFGPCSLDFILMFWAEQQTHFRLRSEIAMAVNAAMLDAGIEIPLPQHEIRVLSSDRAAVSRFTAESSETGVPRAVHAAR